jgi:hypothetical protein
MTTPSLPEQIELHRDRTWRRDEDLRIESAVDAERFIEDVGFGRFKLRENEETSKLAESIRRDYRQRCSRIAESEA